MNITAIQMDIVWNDSEENRRRAEKAIRNAERSDMYVLPEMFTTGFCTHPEEIAELSTDKSLPPTLQWMRQIAKELNCAIVGSVAIKEMLNDKPDGKDCVPVPCYKYFNRMFFVYPDGKYHHYDKRHLFTYGEEDRFYTKGQNRVVVEFRKTRFLLQVCYDLRFPVWSRNTGDYDVAIYVASWPTSRIGVWNTLLTARAIENQCYVVGVNRTGCDPLCEYCGCSRIINPYGKSLGECTDGMESSVTVHIDMEKLEQFRRKFPVIADRDRFGIYLHD